MILAAGLSPAWQQILVINRLATGSVNRAEQAYWCGSGKVLNVGVALHYLADSSEQAALTLAPLGGAAYDVIDREFHEIGVSRRWIRTLAPTRVCTTIVDPAANAATELIENAAALTSDELIEFTNGFRELSADAAAVVLTGSLPAGVSHDYYRDLLEFMPCPAVLDIRGPELLAALEMRPAVVKPNREELAATFATPIDSDADMRQAIAELQRRGAHAVVVTDGKADVWLGVDGDVLQIKPPFVESVVNPIASGDCLAAGLALALARGLDMFTAVQIGIDAAGRNLRTLLPCDFEGERERMSLR